MQDIAEAVGLQKASLYHYISSKEDLLGDIASEALGHYTGQVEAVAAAPLPAQERLRRVVEVHLEALAGHLGLFTVYLRDKHALPPERREKVKAEADRAIRAIEAILRQGMAAGEFRSVHPRMATLAVLGACNWLYTWYNPGGPLSPREIAAHFTDLFLEGLAC